MSEPNLVLHETFLTYRRRRADRVAAMRIVIDPAVGGEVLGAHNTNLTDLVEEPSAKAKEVGRVEVLE